MSNELTPHDNGRQLIDVQADLLATTQKMFADEIAKGQVGGLAAFKAAVESSRHISAIVAEQQRLRLEMENVMDRLTVMRLARVYANEIIEIVRVVVARRGLDPDKIIDDISEELDDLNAQKLIEQQENTT